MYEFDELYNVGYLIAIKQKTVLTLQKSVRGALLTFMSKSSKSTKQCKTLERDNLDSGEENQLALCAKDKCLKSLIDSEELVKIIEEANVDQSSEFLTLLKLQFVDGLSQEQIAKKYNVSQQIISIRCKTIMEALITVNKRRMLCQK